MTNQTIEKKITLKEVIPPPIIFESRGPNSSDIKEKIKDRSHCPHCGLSIHSA